MILSRTTRRRRDEDRSGSETHSRRPFRRLPVLLATFLVLLLVVWLADGPARFCRAMAASAMNADAYVAAHRWIDRSAAVGGDSIESHLLRGRILRWQGRTADAFEQVEMAARQGARPERLSEYRDLILAHRGDLDAARRILSRETLEARRDAYDAVVRCALVHDQQDWAASMLEQWTGDYREDPAVAYLRGRLDELQGRYDAAIGHYREALAGQPELAAAGFRCGVALREQRSFRQAAESFTQGIGTPIEPISRVEAADCLSQLGEFDAAWRTLGAVLTIEPQEILALYLRVDELVEDDRAALVAGRIKSGLGEDEAAVEFLKRALQFNRRNVEARARLAATLRRLKRHDEADRQSAIHRQQVAQRSQSLQLLFHLDAHPDDHDVRCDLAALYLECDSLADAQRQLQTVLQEEPEHARAHRLLARAYRERAHYSDRFRELADQHERLALQYSSESP